MEAYYGSHRIAVTDEQQDQNFVIRYFNAAKAFQAFALERVTRFIAPVFSCQHICLCLTPLELPLPRPLRESVSTTLLLGVYFLALKASPISEITEKSAGMCICKPRRY